MNIGITGASGFVGRHLIRALQASGHDAVAFARNPSQTVAGCRETRSCAPKETLDLSGLDAVVNLAGESIMGPWTQKRRREILESRVSLTTRLAEALVRDTAGPRQLVNASAVGLYGDRGDEILDESKGPGRGFLAEVAEAWEEAARPAGRAGVSVSFVRIGIVLGADGGAFPLLRRLFGLGLGGKLGSGQQWMSPIHVADLAGLIVHLLARKDDASRAEVSGAFNAVCPQPVRNAEFTRALAAALHRPAILPAPAFAMRAALGELATVVLNSQRAIPAHPLQAGYEFQFPTLDSILQDLCKPPAKS